MIKAQKVERLPLKQELGHYMPSFFKLKYNIEGSINDIQFTDFEAVFLHEYIHFMQDIASIFGNINLCNTYNELRAASDTILNNKSNDKIPLPLEIKYSDLMIESITYWEFIYGSNNDKIVNIDKCKIKFEEKIFFKSKKVKRHYFEVDEKRYYIGAIDILEGHAYLIEKEIYGDLFPPPLLPYKTVEILAYQYSNWIFEEKKYLAALCEMSLNFTNPSDFFINSLARIKDEKYTCDDIDNFIEYILSDMKIENEFGTTDRSIDDFMIHYNKKAKEYALDMVKSLNIVAAKEWVNYILDKAIELKSKDKIFITRGIFTTKKRGYYFDLLENHLGSPLLLDKNNFSYQIDSCNSTDSVVYFSAMLEIYNSFIFNQHECTLQDACLKSKELDSYNVNDLCKTAPWDKVHENNLCPYAFILSIWGLSKFNFYIKNNT